MSTLAEMLSADFLLRNALLGSVVVGLVCPLIGVYFVLRRMIFLGVALPQLSAAGVAFAFWLRSISGVHEHGESAERVLAMVGSLGFAFVGLLVLAALERQGRETLEARIGVTYAFAAAASILFVATDPYGEAEMTHLLKGDIVTTTGASLRLLASVLGAVTVALMAFRRELLLVSFDRDMAIVLGTRAGLWDTVLYLLIGLTISFGVMTAGPLVTFGFLVVPPLTARLVTRHMLSFSLVAAGCGATTAFVGFYLAYRYDLPLGPTDVALAVAVLVLTGATRGGLRATRRRPRRVARPRESRVD
jgi:ABC-type Mn2+/Zn2+ transport system permease subunit